MMNSRPEASRDHTQREEIAILPAVCSVELDQIRELWMEYAKWLGFSLCFQGFDKELATLPGKYAPPQGRLYLSRVKDQLAASAALRPIENGICEMKRLYVRPVFRGLGIGRKLVLQLLDDASQIGYTRMRLDTITDKMQTAVNLYRDIGFKEIAPYCENPNPKVLYMELDLTALRPLQDEAHGKKRLRSRTESQKLGKTAKPSSSPVGHKRG